MEIKVYSTNYNKVLKKTELFTTKKRYIQRSSEKIEFKNRKLTARFAAVLKGTKNLELKQIKTCMLIFLLLWFC